MSRLAERKAAARKAAIETRGRVADADAAARAAAHLLDQLRQYEGIVISGYLPIRTEIDPLPAMQAMMDRSPVTLPVIQGPGLPLIFRAWHPGAPMIEASFGTLVPAEGDFLTPRVVIVPLLAFDRAGWRLGYGGGYYDRTLAGLRSEGGALAIGFAFAGQEVGAVEHDERDQKLDLIVTENGAITPA